MVILQIQNIDSFRKAIIDSISAANKQQFNPVDYINKIDSFYNNAWAKLAILFGLIGVFFPLVTSYIQFKRSDSEKDKIKTSVKEELTAEFKDYLKNEVGKIQHASEGVSYEIQSDIDFDKGRFVDAFAGIVNAMTCYLIGEDYCNFTYAFDDLLIRIKKITSADLIKIRQEYSSYYDINELIKKMEKTYDDKYTVFVTKINAQLKNIT